MNDERVDVPLIFSDRITQPESDKIFLARLDDIYGRAVSNYLQALVNQAIGGHPEGGTQILYDYETQMAITPADLDRLRSYSPSDRLGGKIAEALRSVFIGGNSEIQDNDTWLAIQHTLTDGKGTHGCRALVERYRREDDPLQRKKLHAVLHSKDTQLAESIVSHIATHRNGAQEEGVTNITQHILKRQFGLHLDEFSAIIDQIKTAIYPIRKLVTDWVMGRYGQFNIPPYEWEYWQQQLDEKIFVKERAALQNTDDLFDFVMKKLGIIDRKASIRIVTQCDDSIMPRCFPVNPPDHVVVIKSRHNNTVYDATNLFHEAGHALHCIGMSPALPHVLRRNNTNRVWNETMAYLLEDIGIEASVMNRPDCPVDTGFLKTARILRYVDSMTKILCMLSFAQAAYGETDPTIESLDQVWRKIATEYYPHQVTPQGHFDWAVLDRFSGMDPFYLVNYVYAKLCAAQLRAYMKRAFGSLLCTEAGVFLMEQCYKPGLSKSWRQFLRDTTGKDLDPLYFYKEIQEAAPVIKQLIDNCSVF